MKQLYLITLAIIINCSTIYAQTLDDTFKDPIPIRPAKINCIEVLKNDKILIGGDLSFYKSVRVSNLIRLNPDNTLDETFNFEADKHLIIRKAEFLSTGDIVVLATRENEEKVYTDKCTLFRLGPNGEIKNKIDTLTDCNTIAVQNDDKILVCSGTYSFRSQNQHLFRYNSDFSSDKTFNNSVSINDFVFDVKVYNNKIYICGSFTSVNNTSKNGIAKLNYDGTIDPSFDIGAGTSDDIFSMTIQPDGKILLGKSYINYFNGILFHGMLRLNSNGTIDSGFNPPMLNSMTSEITVKDSSMFFASYTSSDGSVLLKLNYDGSFDPEFNTVKLDALSFNDFCIGFPDNKTIFNNSTTTFSKYGLSACDSAGKPISSFAPEITRYGELSVGNYFNNKLLISGDFMKVNNVETYGIAMLNKNGVVDDNFVLTKNLGSVKQVQIFNDTTVFISTFDSFLKLDAKGRILQDFDFKKFTKLNEILKFKALNDGKILAADANGIYRLYSDGMPDPTFNTGTGIENSSTGLDFDLQADKIIWGSDFNSFNGKVVHKLIRLKTDGSLDSTFKIGTGPNSTVFITKVLASGDIITGGWFSIFNGFDTPHKLVKLSKNGLVDSTFLYNQNSSALNIAIIPFSTKIEQVDSIIYIKNKTSIACLNKDGTVNTDFNVPVIINNVNDIITVTDSSGISGGRKSSSDTIKSFSLIALGSFKRSENGDPLFIVKLNLDSKTLLAALSISSASLNLKATDNSSSTFEILSNINWEVSVSQNWLTVSKLSGSNNATIQVTASGNYTRSQRTAVITISGFGVPSRTITVVQATALTYLPEISDSDIRIWPVPVTDKLHISFSGVDKPLYLAIFSPNGSQLYSSKNLLDETEIDMTGVASGIYFIKILTSKGKELTRKIIKQ